MVEMLNVAVCGEMEGTRRLNRFAAEKKRYFFKIFKSFEKSRRPPLALLKPLC